MFPGFLSLFCCKIASDQRLLNCGARRAAFRPYFLNGVQVFGVIVVEAVVFLALIALVYRRQEI